MFIKLTPRSHKSGLPYLLPNLLTTAALGCGLASLHFSLRAGAASPERAEVMFQKAMAAVVIAGIFDALDGRAARLLRVTSKFGAVLDSLSDFLAFGVAPAVILYQWKLQGADLFGSAALMVFPLCSALRLARFTAAAMPGGKEPPPKEPGSRPSNFFVGMPTPAAAGVVLVPPMLFFSDRVKADSPAWVVALLTVCVGFAMISRLPMPSIKGIHVGRKFVAPLLVAVGLLIVAATKDVWATIAGLSILYLLLMPVGILLSLRSRRPMARGGATGLVPEDSRKA